jgi:hypothetical protein
VLYAFGPIDGCRNAVKAWVIVAFFVCNEIEELFDAELSRPATKWLDFDGLPQRRVMLFTIGGRAMLIVF